MKRTVSAALALAVACVLGGAPAGSADDKKATTGEEAAKAARSNMQGLWQYESFEEEGKAATARSLRRKTIFFGGNSVMMKDAAELVQAGQFTLDPETPGAVDLKILVGPFRNITMLGIYELKGNTLRVCYDTAGRERPKEFKSTADSGLFVAVYKRAKAADEPDIAGVYDCQGTEMDGNKYTAKVEIRRVGDAYAVSWAKGGGLMAVGVGLRRGNVLSVSFTNKEMGGIAVYTVAKDRTMAGEWTEVGGIGLLRSELLAPKK